VDSFTPFVFHPQRKKRNVYTILVGKPEGKRPLGRPKQRWENNMKMELKHNECVWLRIRTSGGSSEDGNKAPIQGSGFLDELVDYWPLRLGSAPWSI
jgi:hypothetical protein